MNLSGISVLSSLHHGFITFVTLLVTLVNVYKSRSRYVYFSVCDEVTAFFCLSCPRAYVRVYECACYIMDKDVKSNTSGSDDQYIR